MSVAGLRKRIYDLEQRMIKKVFYLWERLGLKRIEVITQEDTAKQPAIPSATGMRQKMIEATDRAQKTNLKPRWRNDV